jgi:glutamate--cysteine ligase
MIQNQIHELICKNCEKIDEWLVSKKKELQLPFYTSIDIRDSHHKIVSVDANIYPAGFNNICPTDKEHAPEITKQYLDSYYGSKVKKIALLTEEHTKNPFYWENVRWILKMVEDAGYEIRVCLPQSLDREIEMEASSGYKIPVHPFKKVDGELIGTDGFKPDLIISNNDFSNAYESWAEGLKTPINPPRELGWHQRKKSEHFKYFNQLATEFANILGVDPWLLTVETEVLSGFDVNDMDSREAAALKVEAMLERIQKNYDKRGIKDKPTVFVKNNSGTYGLGVMRALSGDDIRQLNSRGRGKMNAAKGGAGVTEVIIQEGVPTAVMTEGIVAEPVVYIVGCDLAGGFFRTHSEKGPDDSLNSPGAVYKKMCVSDLKVDQGDCPIENVYGWVARLSSLAIGYEIKNLNLKIAENPDFKNCGV